jgi:hypothetical protein
VGFEVFKVVKMKITVFWDTMPCALADMWQQSLLPLSLSPTLNMEGDSAETPVPNYHIT